MPEDMPEDMLEDMPDRMPDRIPEDMSAISVQRWAQIAVPV